MAVKPLTATQKKVIASLARALVFGEVEKKVAGWDGFKDHMFKTDPEAAQAERALQSAVERFRKALVAEMEKRDGA